MGLYIHYSGRLQNNDRLKDLVADVISTCDKFEWSYFEYGKSNQKEIQDEQEKLRGISFSPDECKSIHLTFDIEGNLYNLRYKLQTEKWEEDTFIEMIEFSKLTPVSAKTLEAGYLGHKRIIHLFKYLSEKYLTEFTFKDDAGYWNHMDDKKLANYFGLTDIKLDSLKDLIEHAPDSGMELEEMIQIHSTDRKTQRWLDGDPLYREIYAVCP